MDEPGTTRPDPDEPRVLTPDAVYVPEVDEEIEAAGAEAELVAATSADPPSDPGATADGESDEPRRALPGRVLEIVRASTSVLGKAATRVAALARAYPRAAVAVGLSVLVLSGVLSMKRGRAPIAEIPAPGRTPVARVDDDEVEKPREQTDEPGEQVDAPAPVDPDEAEKLAETVPEPTPPAIPEPASAALDDVKQAAADLAAAPELPPEVDLAAEAAPEPTPAAEPSAPDPSPIGALLAFNDLKPDHDEAPAPAPAAEEPKKDVAPDSAPEPAPAAEPPPEVAPASLDPPDPAPATAPEKDAAATPAPAAELPPEVAPAPLDPPDPAPAVETPEKDDAPIPAPAPAAEPLPEAAPAPAAELPPVAAPTAGLAPATGEGAGLDLGAPAPAARPTPPSPPSTAESPPIREAPAPAKTEGGDAEPDDGDDWLPITHVAGSLNLDPKDMGLIEGDLDARSSRGKEFVADLTTPTAPIRAVGAAGAGAAVAAAAAAASRSAEPDRRDDGKMETILHKVRPGENFWTISRTHYASGRYYKALGKANSDQFQRLQDLYVGAVIRIPPPEDLDPTLVDPPGGKSARDRDPDAVDQPRVQTAADAPGLRRSRRSPDALDLPASDPEAEQASDRDRRRRAPRDDFAEPAPRRAAPAHRVRVGQTLRSIARDRLGDSHRAREILDLNRDVVPDPAHLEPGIVLNLPDDAE